MRRNPQRLAWTVLLVSLFTCLVLAVAGPWAVSSFVNDSVDAAIMTLDVQQGTVLVSREGVAGPIGVTTSLNNLAEASSIRATDENGQALLTIRSPRDNAILQTVSIYGNTDLDIREARAPRFQQSTRPYQIDLKVNRGRVSTTVANGNGRPIETTLITLQATTNLQEGSYSIDVNNDEMQVTVREGSANVSAQGSMQTLNTQQRTVVKLNSRPSGVLSPESNIVTNGNFRLSLDDWEVSGELQNTNELSGTVTIDTVGGQRSAVFDRTGAFHAKTSIRQNINRDVRGFGSLRLHFVVRVLEQDVPVCGQLGSECPLMMQLDYKDEKGMPASFYQGFYAKTDPNGVNPDFIVGAGSKHRRIVSNVAYTYDSADLMETLQPQQIIAISFYASGHSYRSSIAEIELLGKQQ